jgi:hypothetical protein
MAERRPQLWAWESGGDSGAVDGQPGWDPQEVGKTAVLSTAYRENLLAFPCSPRCRAAAAAPRALLTLAFPRTTSTATAAKGGGLTGELAGRARQLQSVDGLCRNARLLCLSAISDAACILTKYCAATMLDSEGASFFRNQFCLLQIQK